MQDKENKNDYDQKPASRTLQKAPKNLLGFSFWLLSKIQKQKKWWLLPVWALLFAVALLILLAGHGAIIPAIYMAF